MESTVVTREELYRQVWETPMTRLAASYGVSGNGLAKICDRLNVPYPPRGYWARKGVGQKVIEYRLPPSKAGTPTEVRITRTPPKAKTVFPAAEFMDQAVRIHEQIFTSGKATPSKLHPIVQTWVREREQAIKGYKRDRLQFGSMPQPFSDTDRRKHQLLSKLLWILEGAGGKVTDKQDGNVECVITGELILFQVREKSRQVRLPPPQGKARSDYYPRTELRPSGYLVLSVKTTLPGGLRQEWTEKGDTSLDELAPEIAATMIAAGPLLVENRLQREEEARLRKEEEHRRYEEQQRRRTDRNRWRRFLEHAGRHRDAELARNFLAALENEGVSPEESIDGRPIGNWLQWVKDWIEAYDTAKRGAKWVFGDVSEVTNWTYHSE